MAVTVQQVIEYVKMTQNPNLQHPLLFIGFVEVRGAHVFSGDYPEQLLNLWDRFAEEKGTENERPDKLGFGQNYIALEFNNAGAH